ncbi:MAG: SPL family radical SAM protein [Candidatus Caldatribacteriaceae bacterium]
MAVIQYFDPWKGKFCTCPPKYTLNPYTGCRHGCLYCYITSFIPQAFTVREKPHLLKNVERELPKLDPLYLSLSNSSDPYPQEEEDQEYTRTILTMCKDRKVPVLILTKSPLVVRDIDILRKMQATVSLTITTIDPEKAKLLEPEAPPPEARLKALIKLSQEGIPTVLRLDPIIVGVNDDPEEWEEILKILRSSVQQVVVSTFKPRRDSFARIAQAFPEMTSTWPQYSQKEGNSLYLKRDKRREMLATLRATVHRYGIRFSSCREGFPEWNDLHCDGSSFLKSQSSSSPSAIGGTPSRG